jgi:hypothetical protein
MRATTGRKVALAVAVFTIFATGLATTARAAEPTGEPVKWDQARVTKYAVELTGAVGEAVQRMRENPLQTAPTQRQTWYDLKEDLRLIENSTGHLQSQLQSGLGAEETRATFDRVGALRRDAEEDGRRAEIPAPVMDALVKAGAIHNLMQPYYHGKR